MAHMQTVYELIEIIKKHRKSLKEEYGVKEIGIFGSYARGGVRK